MRIGLDDTLWCVTDAGPNSTLGDVLFQTSLRGLHTQFLGGLRPEQNPTLFTAEDEASEEARQRTLPPPDRAPDPPRPPPARE